MKEYPYLFGFLLGVLQLILAILAFKYYEYLTAGEVAFTYPALLLLIQNWKNNIKDNEESI
jgi:hypothetical protein